MKSNKKFNNISPHVYVLSTFLITLIAFFYSKNNGVQNEYFFVWIFALGAIYAAINFYRQLRGEGHFSVQKNINFNKLIKRALVRYAVWWLVFFIGYSFFRSHPYYSGGQFEKSIDFLEHFFDLYQVAGLPYFFVTLMLKSSRIEDFYDPAIRLIHIFKKIFGRALRPGNNKPVFRVMRNKYNRKVLLNLLMRAYFIPAMVVQIHFQLNSAVRYSNNGFNNYDFITILLWLTAILWLMDVLNASLSYCVESRWIENRTRSIDLTAGGWLACLSCYAPLNQVTGTLFPFAMYAVSNNPADLLVPNDALYYGIRIVETIVLVMHVYTDVSLGPSVANITLKRLQTRGFYGIIRHPGTVFKLSLWWVSAGFYRSFWTFRHVFGHIMWNVIYILRALSEERHLSHFKEYREYKKKVKSRFFPGLF